MPKNPPTVPASSTEYDADEEIQQRRKAVLLRMLGLAKPWRKWIILSNILIVFGSFLGVFSLIFILPILKIIFTPKDAALGNNVKDHGAQVISVDQQNGNADPAKRALLQEHESKLSTIVAEESRITSQGQTLFSKIKHIPQYVRDKRQEYKERISLAAVTNPVRTVYIICICFLLVTLLSAFFEYGSDLCINFVQTEFLRSLSRKLYYHCLTHDVAFHNKYPLGTMLNRVYNDVLKMRAILDLMYGKRVRQPLTLFFATIMLFVVNPLMATIIVLSVPIFVIPAILLSRRIRRISRAETGVDSTVMQVMEEQLGGVRLIKSFGAEEQEMARFDRVNADAYRRRWKRGFFTDMSDPVMDVMISIGLALVIIFGIQAILIWKLPGFSGETYIFFLVVLSRFYAPLKDLASLNVDLQRPLMSAEAIFRVLDLNPKLIDAPDAKPFPKPWHEIAIQNVCFRYGRNSPYVLKNINLTLRAGESVAILGHNGSGKTTLTTLLYRFYDPVEGRILIDGVDLRELRTADLRKEFGSVGQHAMLFDVPLTENIAFGAAPEDIDIERVHWAARQTGADQFINELPDGLNTAGGRHGLRLSGGQRQLITLARVYYNRFSLIIYDEPTTHLDVEASDTVMRCMQELRHEHTVVLITHNVQHALGFDRVVLMQAGEIVQDTTPDQIDKNLLRRFEQEGVSAA